MLKRKRKERKVHLPKDYTRVRKQRSILKGIVESKLEVKLNKVSKQSHVINHEKKRNTLKG